MADNTSNIKKINIKNLLISLSPLLYGFIRELVYEVEPGIEPWIVSGINHVDQLFVFYFVKHGLVETSCGLWVAVQEGTLA